MKIAADGFDLGDQRREIKADDLPEAERVMKAWFKGKLTHDFASPLAWMTVEKKGLLADKNTSLSAERFFGGEVNDSVIERVTLGDIATFEYGHTAVATESGEALYIRITDIDPYGRLRPNDGKFIPLDKEARASIAKRGDVFVARIGATAGKTLLFNSNELAVFASYLIRIRFDPVKMLPEFYWCLTQSKEYWAQREQLISGGGQPQLNANALKLLEIPLPPLEEQRRIVAEIEGYQQVIDGARQILAAYRPSFEIDPEWSVVELREVVTFSSGGTPPKSAPAYWTGNIPWVSAKDMKVPKLADSALHVSKSAVAETATQLAPVGSILILVRGMGLANGVPICELLAPCAFNQDIKALQPKPNVDSAFLAAALRQEVEQFKNALGTAAHGTLKIESEQLQKIRIPLPPLPEQRRIVAELDAEAAEVAAVRALIPRTEAKIQRVLARVWGTAT